MPYRKGELTSAAVDRGWPHQVALRSDLVMRDFHVIQDFCRDLSLCRRGHSVNDARDWYRVYCFAEPEDAAKFMARFGGEMFDPADRGRGGPLDAVEKMTRVPVPAEARPARRNVGGSTR